VETVWKDVYLEGGYGAEGVGRVEADEVIQSMTMDEGVISKPGDIKLDIIRLNEYMVSYDLCCYTSLSRDPTGAT
jgi:hypothetical protein